MLIRPSSSGSSSLSSSLSSFSMSIISKRKLFVSVLFVCHSNMIFIYTIYVYKFHFIIARFCFAYLFESIILLYPPDLPTVVMVVKIQVRQSVVKLERGIND